ncbi:M48 family metalloprotease [Thiomicrospira cyclica]|uniref:Peptidase M48 Ste24p n=1 Tax=Thiomicrospira cyclica (strain DSM 14477 / JCM 11371 / ALM1) TaxID=717773 RepID=F6D9V9_THICA|nr:M48 family metalloprotease [Thiomicrospira cyclica]AEG30996.1 peptidase M48 Ste24p [Thiomicrospira cyclica ALM1]
MQKLFQLVILSLVFLSSYVHAHTATQNLPDLGSPGLVLYDRNMELTLGRAFLTALHTEYNMTNDPYVLAYIRRIGENIIAHVPDGRNYRFFVIDRPEINAFAGPDGIIGINTGLILAAASEDELASVIAHEIAHITQEHLSRRFEQFEQGNITTLASLLAAILIGTQNPSAGIATFIGGNSLAIQNQLRFSRIHEHEADSIGIQLLSKAGYSPSAMSRFFDQLHRQHNHTNRPPEILLTHPVTERRTALAMARAEQLPVQPEQRLNLKLIQARLNPGRIETKGLSAAKQNSLICYQAYLKALNTPDSIDQLSCLDTAIAEHPNNRLLKIAAADIKDRGQETPEHLKALAIIYPQDNALANTIAQHLIDNQKLDDAIVYLEGQRIQSNQSIELLATISELYMQNDKTAHALYFQAVREIEIGNIARAKHLVKQAKNHTKNETELTKKIKDLEQKIAKIS